MFLVAVSESCETKMTHTNQQRHHIHHRPVYLVHVLDFDEGLSFSEHYSFARAEHRSHTHWTFICSRCWGYCETIWEPDQPDPLLLVALGTIVCPIPKLVPITKILVSTQSLSKIHLFCKTSCVCPCIYVPRLPTSNRTLSRRAYTMIDYPRTLKAPSVLLLSINCHFFANLDPDYLRSCSSM
jgi:hypothetical protein